MNDAACRERIRRFASQVGLEVFFIEAGALEHLSRPAAVFTVEDFDSSLEPFDPATVSDADIRAAIVRARHELSERCGCEIVHDGAGVFRCLRHDVECDTGEEQDPVIRQTLRWTAACPVGGVTQAFYLWPNQPEEV